MDPVHIREINFCMGENAPLHRTDKYVSVRKGTENVLRRGQAFLMEFQVVGRDFDLDIDLVRINFSFGNKKKCFK